MRGPFINFHFSIEIKLLYHSKSPIALKMLQSYPFYDLKKLRLPKPRIGIKLKSEHLQIVTLLIRQRNRPAKVRLILKNKCGCHENNFTSEYFLATYDQDQSIERDINEWFSKVRFINPSTNEAFYIGPSGKTVYIAATKNSDFHLLGFYKRICSHYPVDHNLILEFKSFCQSYIHRNFTPLDNIEFDHELTDRYWLDGSKYTINQKQNFHNLLERLKNEPVRYGPLLAMNSFIKQETYDEVKFPRIINSRSDAFKVITAPLIKQIEQQVYNEHYIKHKTPIEVRDRMIQMTQLFDNFYETDYTSFEQSFTNDVADACERELLLYMTKANRFVHTLIKMVYSSDSLNRCYAKNFSGSVPGSRMSGEMWTSLCNGFTNQMLIEFMHHKWKQSNIHSLGKIDYIVEGDDGFIATDHDLDLSITRRLGFILKCECVHSINDCSFCGLSCGPQGQIMPNFWNTINNIGISYSPLLKSKKRFNRNRLLLLKAKMQSCLACSIGCPILQPLALHYIESLNNLEVPYNEKYYDWWEIHCLDIDRSIRNFHVMDITPEMRAFFADRTGIPISVQIRFEAIIDRLTYTDDLNRILEACF